MKTIYTVENLKDILYYLEESNNPEFARVLLRAYINSYSSDVKESNFWLPRK